MKIRLMVLVGLTVLCGAAQAQLVQQFKNPAFSGAGWSSHALTIDSIEKSRKDAIESQKKSEAAAAEAAAQNTPLARFMALFQSQVYAQLATQLSNNLFQNRCASADGAAIPGCVNPTSGVFTLDGNTITWVKSDKEVTLTVVDKAGTVTTVKVPLASFGF
jgi:Type VIII secretion system (T8SS), CsgF protein